MLEKEPFRTLEQDFPTKLEQIIQYSQQIRFEDNVLIDV